MQPVARARSVDISHAPKLGDVNAFFLSITPELVEQYKTYWSSLTPEDYIETFERWLFAFCSVHTTWSANVRGFQAIRSWSHWYQDPVQLRRMLEDSRIGLQANRTKFIGRFAEDFWNNPHMFYYTGQESWTGYRDRLVNRVLGLGPAKVSFALEMIYPCAAQVVCLDTHMFQLYGLDQTKHARYYHTLERHWVSRCLDLNVPCPIARAIYWDRKQEKPDSRYWTYVIEREQPCQLRQKTTPPSSQTSAPTTPES